MDGVAAVVAVAVEIVANVKCDYVGHRSRVANAGVDDDDDDDDGMGTQAMRIAVLVGVAVVRAKEMAETVADGTDEGEVAIVDDDDDAGDGGGYAAADAAAGNVMAIDDGVADAAAEANGVVVVDAVVQGSAGMVAVADSSMAAELDSFCLSVLTATDRRRAVPLPLPRTACCCLQRLAGDGGSFVGCRRCWWSLSWTVSTVNPLRHLNRLFRLCV